VRGGVETGRSGDRSEIDGISDRPSSASVRGRSRAPKGALAKVGSSPLRRKGANSGRRSCARPRASARDEARGGTAAGPGGSEAARGKLSVGRSGLASVPRSPSGRERGPGVCPAPRGRGVCGRSAATCSVPPVVGGVVLALFVLVVFFVGFFLFAGDGAFRGAHIGGAVVDDCVVARGGGQTEAAVDEGVDEE
jgi:hypothetical protein